MQFVYTDFSNELATVQNLYIRAARKNPAHDLDADVQCGLGVLFNLASDYDKAADCFQAAVNADPNVSLKLINPTCKRDSIYAPIFMQHFYNCLECSYVESTWSHFS